MILGDIQDIRATIHRAAERFLANSHRVEPNTLAMIVTVLNGKLAVLDAWLTGEWSDAEMVVMLEFIERWRHEEQVIERLRPTFDAGCPDGYFDVCPPEQWFPIPSMEIPKRRA